LISPDRSLLLLVVDTIVGACYEPPSKIKELGFFLVSDNPFTPITLEHS